MVQTHVCEGAFSKAVLVEHVHLRRLREQFEQGLYAGLVLVLHRPLKRSAESFTMKQMKRAILLSAVIICDCKCDIRGLTCKRRTPSDRENTFGAVFHEGLRGFLRVNGHRPQPEQRLAYLLPASLGRCLAPALMSALMTSACPLAHDRCRAVLPCLS